MRARTCLVLLVSAGALSWPGFTGRCAFCDEPALAPIAANAPLPAFVEDVQPLLTKYCFECHRGEKAKGGLAFDTFRDERTAIGRPQTWEKVLDNLESGLMPPEGKPQPTNNERALVIRWIESRFFGSGSSGL